jgi:hypothetical protein
MIGRRLVAALGALTLAAASPPAAEYPLADVEGEALVVPAASPVKFTGFEDHVSRYAGELMLTGTLVYRCDVDCDVPIDPRNFVIFVIPDPALAETLPYWKTRRSEIHVYFENDEALARKVISAAERKPLLAGKADEVRKRVVMTVDRFQLGIDCDSASYRARFVALARPPTLVRSRAAIEGGCS